jgi:NADPH:quinone reductase-like Zn-dependent oxidoreductase
MNTSAISSVTRTWRFHQTGGPDALRLEPLPTPEPGYGQVRLRVQSLSLNRADLLWLADTYVESPELPSRIGYEVAGVIEAIGPDVTAWKVGDRVSAAPAFSIKDYANFAETAVLPERVLLRRPDNFPVAQASAFSFAYFTGYGALVEWARLLPYQTLVVTAATSTTGLAAIALARKLGACVIATTRTSRKRAVLEQAGAHHVIATEEEDVTARVLNLTDGGGADVIYDCVAGRLLERLASAIKIRGHYVVYGLLDLELSAPPMWEVFKPSPHFVVYKVFDYTGNRHLGLPGDGEAFARARHFIAAGLVDGSLPPLPIDREFHGLEALPEAMRYMATNQAAGKIVVTL